MDWEELNVVSGRLSLRVRASLPGTTRQPLIANQPATMHARLHAPSRHAHAHARCQGLPIDRPSGYSARDFRVAYVPVRFQLYAALPCPARRQEKGPKMIAVKLGNYSSTPPILPHSNPSIALLPFAAICYARQNGSLRLLVRDFWPACYFSTGVPRGAAKSTSQWSNCDMARRYRSSRPLASRRIFLSQGLALPRPSCARSSTAVPPRQDV